MLWAKGQLQGKEKDGVSAVDESGLRSGMLSNTQAQMLDASRMHRLASTRRYDGNNGATLHSLVAARALLFLQEGNEIG
jgi:hypothetical protein